MSSQADNRKGKVGRVEFLKVEHGRLAHRDRVFSADNYKVHFSGQEIPAEMLGQLAPLEAEVEPA
jgi:hypothetical protein